MTITHEQLDMLSRIYNAMCEIARSAQAPAAADNVEEKGE